MYFSMDQGLMFLVREGVQLLEMSFGPRTTLSATAREIDKMVEKAKKLGDGLDAFLPSVDVSRVERLGVELRRCGKEGLPNARKELALLVASLGDAHHQRALETGLNRHFAEKEGATPIDYSWRVFNELFSPNSRIISFRHPVQMPSGLQWTFDHSCNYYGEFNLRWLCEDLRTRKNCGLFFFRNENEGIFGVTFIPACPNLEKGQLIPRCPYFKPTCDVIDYGESPLSLEEALQRAIYTAEARNHEWEAVNRFLRDRNESSIRWASAHAVVFHRGNAGKARDGHQEIADLCGMSSFAPEVQGTYETQLADVAEEYFAEVTGHLKQRVVHSESECLSFRFLSEKRYSVDSDPYKANIWIPADDRDFSFRQCVSAILSGVKAVIGCGPSVFRDPHSIGWILQGANIVTTNVLVGARGARTFLEPAQCRAETLRMVAIDAKHQGELHRSWAVRGKSPLAHRY